MLSHAIWALFWSILIQNEIQPPPKKKRLLKIGGGGGGLPLVPHPVGIFAPPPPPPNPDRAYRGLIIYLINAKSFHRPLGFAPWNPHWGFSLPLDPEHYINTHEHLGALNIS